MNTSKFKLTAIFVAIGLSIGIGLSNSEAADYFPLEVGNRWIYSPSYGESGDRIDTIVGTETVNGILTYIWKREEAAPDNYHEKFWLAKDGSDLKVYKIWSNIEFDQTALITPPWVRYKLNPAVGDTWVYKFNLGIIHGTATYYVESINDTVTVPAGTFNNCIRVRELNEITQNGFTEYEYEKHWLAPDVGPIIYRDYTNNWESVDFSQDLVSFSNIGSVHIDINTNQDEYEVNDTLRTYISIYNAGSCVMGDIYIAIQLTDGTLLFYPDFSTSVHPVLPYSVNICGSPFISDYILFEYTIPISFPKGTYTWYAVLIPPGADLYNPVNWLSFDEAPFNVN